jgi:Ca-activated chloride channel family protein
MRLLSPDRLWLLVLVAALVATYVVMQQRRRHYAVRFTNLDLLDSVAPKRPGWRRHAVALAALLGVTTLVVSLAQPARAEKVPRGKGVIMLVIDESASMMATDVSPSRLEAAQASAKRFVKNTPSGIQIGVVAFNSSASVLAQPTTDRDEVNAAIDSLRTGAGTAGGEGVYAALSAIKAALGSKASLAATNQTDLAATIVLLSDGQTTVGRPLEQAAQAAADVGVPINTIAFGTQNGVVEIQGRVIPVPADTASLATAAQISKGKAFEATTGSQLDSVYKQIQGRIGYRTVTRDLSRWFVGFSVVALILAIGASIIWTARFL